MQYVGVVTLPFVSTGIVLLSTLLLEALIFSDVMSARSIDRDSASLLLFLAL